MKPHMILQQAFTFTRMEIQELIVLQYLRKTGKQTRVHISDELRVLGSRDKLMHIVENLIAYDLIRQDDSLGTYQEIWTSPFAGHYMRLNPVKCKVAALVYHILTFWKRSALAVQKKVKNSGSQDTDKK